MQIKKSGVVFPVDSCGYVVNITAVEKLHEPWKSAVDAAVEAVLRNIEANPAGVFLRGSLPLGRALAGVSDVDLIVVSHGDWRREAEAIQDRIDDEVRPRFPFLTQVETRIISRGQLFDDHAVMMAIKTQSLRLLGEDLAAVIPNYKPGPDMVVHAWDIKRDLAWFHALTRHRDLLDGLEIWVQWIARRLLRTGFEIVMEREGCYTRDLYPCYQGFARHYPERQAHMLRILEFAIHPPIQKEKFLGLFDEMGEWLGTEVIAVLGLHRIMEIVRRNRQARESNP